MNMDRGERLAFAKSELDAGQWASAADAFGEILAGGEDPDARLGLGSAAWWQGETVPALRHWEEAYVAYRRRGDHGDAVVVAAYMSLAYLMSLGNRAAARGWIARAERLERDHHLADLVGWVSLSRAHYAIDEGQPQEGERWAREGMEVARAVGDVDLELCLVSELGMALIEQGELQEGARLLDEAMAGALAGEGHDPDAVVLISCRSIMASSRGGDVRRAMAWIRAADDFHQRRGSPHLYTTCRSEYGSLLFATGEWERAEQELDAARRIGVAVEPALHAEATAKLVELRIAQGRLDEAAGLITGLEDHPTSTRAVALLHLARGEASAAAAVLRRRLHDIDERTLAAAPLHELLAQADLERDTPDKALARSEWLIELGLQTGNDLIVARGHRALGRARLAVGDRPAAVEQFERAVAIFGRNGMPYESGLSRLLLAQAASEGDREVAIAEARTALATFEELGADRDADAAAALLRALGSRSSRRGPRAVGTLTRREIEVLTLLGEGLSNREIGDRLFITRKTVEHHVSNVLAKVGLSGRGDAAAYAVRHLGGDQAPK